MAPTELALAENATAADAAGANGTHAQSKPSTPTMVDHVWSDFANPLQHQTLGTRLLCFPCQCGWAFSHALCSADCDGAMSVLFCCPCRTCCGHFPTSAEQGRAVLGLDEPDTVPYQTPSEYDELPEEGVEISYERVFEMERKKRQILNQVETH
mmetsp:Transcript_6857/g.13955  ORF Transcript_6857/g.13955 Transcript_6857/m.13955 type:complete len:154 (+) Transcript_6857:60-521(+)